MSLESLAFLGPDAVPVMTELTTNVTRSVQKRGQAAASMRNMTYLGSNAAPCVAALVQCVSTTNDRGNYDLVTSMALETLRVFSRPEAEPYFEENRRLSNAVPDTALRLCALTAIADLATNSKNLYYQVAYGTNDPDATVRTEAMRLLLRLDQLEADAQRHE